MALTRLCSESIGDLDEGRAALIIDAALAQIYRDLEERGHDEKARALTITLTFQTNKGLVVTDLQAKVSTPPYRTNITAAKMLSHKTAKGAEPVLGFQEYNADNPDQGTFSELDKEEGEI